MTHASTTQFAAKMPAFEGSDLPAAAPHRHDTAAFTLLEILVVVAIIAIALGFLVPALGIGSARALEGDTRQFVAQLEDARQIAIAERTRTRVIIPIAQETSSLGENLPLRAYAVASLDRTAGTWKQRGKWNRVSQSVAFNKSVGV